MRILVVEDEKMLADSISDLLRSNGYNPQATYDGIEGLEQARLGIFDLVILDVMLPRLSGFDVAMKLRKEKIGTPILMLTARSDLDDRVNGLESGADYYLTKPFESKELLACIHALLRRQKNEVNAITFGDLSLDLSGISLSCGSESIRLSSKEFDVMRLLLQAGSGNIPKSRILDQVWGYDSEAIENNVEVYIAFLRKKLNNLGSQVKIVAVRNVGYHLEEA
jgi:DNA-binding response OmpR family regulator